jgi:SH3-like domain-containing protein
MPLPTWANVAEGPLLVRQGPSTASQYDNVLQKGDPVQVVAFYNDGEWAQIESPQAGWVSNDFLLYRYEDAPNSAVRLGVQQLQARYDTNVLAAPDVNAAETATLDRDEIVIVAATVAVAAGEPVTWYQIADPVVGWVAASDLGAVAP